MSYWSRTQATKQEAQLSQRPHGAHMMRRVVKILLSLKVVQGHSKVHRRVGGV